MAALHQNIMNFAGADGELDKHQVTSRANMQANKPYKYSMRVVPLLVVSWRGLSFDCKHLNSREENV